MPHGTKGFSTSFSSVLAVIWFAALCGTVIARDIADFSPAAFMPGESSPAAVSVDAGGIRLMLPFRRETERVFWDISISPPQSDSAAFMLEYTCDDPGAIRSVTLHLQDGKNWLSAAAVPHDETGMLIFNRSDFSAESGSPLWHRAKKMRLSFWPEAKRPAVFLLRSLREVTLSAAVIRGGPGTAPDATVLATRCAGRAAKLFQRAGMPAVIVDDDFEALNLDDLQWIVLPYNPSLEESHISFLKKFVHKHNGRIAVFYNSNKALAELMNVEPLPYTSQKQPWTTVEFEQKGIRYLPKTMTHFTSHLLPVKGDGKSSLTTGYWQTIDGFPDKSLPAAVTSEHGLWFSHIPPLATPSAVQWCAAQLAASDPDRLPLLEQYMADRRQREKRLKEFTCRPAASNEVRAVWSAALPARRRADIMQKLASSGINVLFEHIATAGMLRESAGPVRVPATAGTRRQRFYIKNITATAHRHGIEMHAWIILFNAEGLPSEELSRLDSEGRLMLDQSGESLPWLCPSHPDNRSMLMEKLLALASTEIDGIHLDYVRYPGNSGCYSHASRRAFEQWQKETVENWPADVMKAGRPVEAYETFRRGEITSFLKEAVKEIHRIRPGLKLSAAVFPTAEAAAANGQDWPEWLQQDLLDFICPMIYTHSTEQFSANVAAAVKKTGMPQRIIPGIGVTADESQLDALSTIEQIRAVREEGCAGYVLFQLDSELTGRVLPFLR